MSEEKKYIEQMAEWGRECAEWQLRNHDKDLVTELAKAQTESGSGGDNPPPPPPHP